MFAIRFVTDNYAPDLTVVLRTSGDNWIVERGGDYTDGAWVFELDEQLYPNGLEFKFVLKPNRWMLGNNLALPAGTVAGQHDYDESTVTFPPNDAVIIEHGVVPQRFFVRNLDPKHVYDVIVVGSGMGGGILASRLADAGLDVLILEVGSYLFPTHVGNLPRRLKIGQFDKHIWSLWQDFGLVNYVNAPGSNFQGAQAFNLGGRSLFWGGLIPRQAAYELAAWPTAVRADLLGGGYAAAETALNAVTPQNSAYQDASRASLGQTVAGYTPADAPMAVQYFGFTKWSLPGGMFSTADLLLEDRLVNDPGLSTRKPPTVNLNHAVWRITLDPNHPQRVTGVVGYDLLAQEQRQFTGNTVVLAAGTIESAKIALQSGLADPNQLIGKGLTDHTIRYRHFTLPPDSPHASETDSAKVLLRHPDAAVGSHAFDIVVELGANFDQGRYIDPNNLAEERKAQQKWMLCEVVFMYYADLAKDNELAIMGQPADPVIVNVGRVAPSNADLAESDDIAQKLFADIGAQSVLGENGLALQDAALGGVAHEVGTLRMADGGRGVVDSKLKFLEYDNLYACDNSVFPVSPAANPSLTLVALALRLADQLSSA